MSATIEMRITWGTSGSPISAEAESGFTFGRDDSRFASVPVPRPETLGTAYSYAKTLHLHVQSAVATAVSNRRIRLVSPPPTGVSLFFRNGGTTYTQATAPVLADNLAANDFVPNGWSLLSTTFQTWDAATATAVTNTRNGEYVLVAIGISATYLGSAGSNVTIPNLMIQYDES